MAWGFQRNSELLPIVNHYLGKMEQAGVIDRLRHKYSGYRHMDTANSKNHLHYNNGLGFENVVLPFSILLAGICWVLLQLGIEFLHICKKKCFRDRKHPNEVESKSMDADDIIDEITSLLKENHGELGGVKFLSKVKMLSTLPESRP